MYPYRVTDHECKQTDSNALNPKCTYFGLYTCTVYVILPLFFPFVFQVKLYKQTIVTQHGHRQSEQNWKSQDQKGSLLTKVKKRMLFRPKST